MKSPMGMLGMWVRNFVKSAIVCFFDDDVVLGNKRVIENFYNELKDYKIGLISSQLAPKSSSLFQKWISYDLSKASSNIKQNLLIVKW